MSHCRHCTERGLSAANLLWEKLAKRCDESCIHWRREYDRLRTENERLKIEMRQWKARYADGPQERIDDLLEQASYAKAENDMLRTDNERLLKIIAKCDDGCKEEWDQLI